VKTIKRKMTCKQCGASVFGRGPDMASHLRSVCPKAKPTQKGGRPKKDGTFNGVPIKRHDRIMLTSRPIQILPDIVVNELVMPHTNGKFDPVSFAVQLRGIDIVGLQAELDAIEKRRLAIGDVLRAVKSLADF
jgi:hypothetical protein